jgi:hypothetical protein
MASVVFACMSLFLFRTYGQAHWIPSRYVAADGKELFHRVLTDVGPIRDQVDLAYRALAAAALFWCIWAWTSEPRLASIIATVFTALAVFCAVFIVI